METKIKELRTENEYITKERDKYKSEAADLRRELRNTPWEILGYTAAGVIVGGIAGWFIGRRHNNPPAPTLINPRNISRNPDKVIKQAVVLQSGIDYYPHDIASIIPFSGNISITSYSHDNTTPASRGSDEPPQQSDEMNDSPISNENTGVEMVTNISGAQCSGTFTSSHLENIPLPDVHVIPASPPVFIPLYTFIPLTPPETPADSLLWQQLQKTTEKQFKQHMKRFFEHLGYKVTLTKASHDKGADMILERGWEKIVIQLKQWKQNVGFSAIQEAYTAKSLYNANRAIIICTSSFTIPVKQAAEKLHVELWDGKRLLAEFYTHQFFLPPEPETDQPS